jgi:hypothetical protein
MRTMAPVMRRAALWPHLPWGLVMAMAMACAPPPRLWRARSPVIRASNPAPARSGQAPIVNGPASFVERSLYDRGLRLAASSSVGALYRSLRERYGTVAPARARAGDVIFFDLVGTGCATHAGVVESVDPSGRITFRERRDGDVRRSYAAPGDPRIRRDPKGQILNTFLRARRLEDAPGLHYFSGEMLCAVVRVGGPAP